jgi:hypothetical protein
MRVFLSWSGTISRDLAAALHEWIPLVVQCARPFISTGDIEKGKRWSDVLGDELSKSGYGIVCVTRDNYAAPWLHFEAGAISKAIDKSYVSPLLFGIDPSEISGPLTQFQLTVCSKVDILSLMRSINSRLGDDYKLSDELLTREFEKWWPDLEVKLKELATTLDERTHTFYPWLYTTEDLTRAHRTKAGACIWWITPNPFEYVLTPSIKESIRDCMKSGVSFTFIIPEDSSADAKPLFKQLAPDKSTVNIVEIPNDEFHREAVTDYVVVDPDVYSTEVFLELPVGPRGYWINVVGEAAGSFAARFRSLARGQGKELASSATVGARSTVTDIARN